MKKQHILYAAIAMLPLCTTAETLTPQDALLRAQQINTAKSIKAGNDLTLIYTEMTVAENPAVYVFESSRSDGYMLVSADDVAVPVLGYVESGSFDPENIAPGMAAWLQEYARRIQYANSVGEKATESLSVPVIGDAIEPMIRTKWNQGRPYNNKTPLSNGAHCVTGCVATALAQVMNYWQWPAVGHGTATATVDGVEQTPLDLSTIPFQWNLMDNTYSDTSFLSRINAVSDLMLACGYAVKMKYTQQSSGAYMTDLSAALVNHFDYNKNIRYITRNFYSGTEWNRLVYDELKAGRPVLYSGSSITGSHCFLVDGYDNGYFHINWGWGGMSDGFFMLDALEPGSQGIGGSAGGYNFGQSFVQGVQIESTEYVEQGYVMEIPSGGVHGESYEDYVIEISSSTLDRLDNGTNVNVTGIMSVLLENTGSTSWSKYLDTNRQISDLKPGWGYSDWTIRAYIPYDTPDGNYRVTLGFKDQNGKWTPVRCPADNFFYIDKNGGSISVTNPADNRTLTVSGEISSQVYKDSFVRMNFTARNESDGELSQGVYGALFDSDGEIVYCAEGFVLTLQPGEEVSKEFTTKFEVMNEQLTTNNADTEYVFRYIDPISGVVYDMPGQKVTVKRQTGQQGLYLKELRISGIKQESISDGGNYVTGYRVGSPRNIPFEAVVYNTGTSYWANYVHIAIWANNDYINNGVSIDNATLGNAVFMAPGENATATGQISFNRIDDYPDQKIFRAYVLYINDNNQWAWPECDLSNNGCIWFMIDESGIVDTFADSQTITIDYDRTAARVIAGSTDGIGNLEIFSLDGVSHGQKIIKHDDSTAVISLDNLVEGVYIVVATDTLGNRKAIKIVK